MMNQGPDRVDTGAKPILYVKSGCPWCEEAEAHLKQAGIEYTRRDARANRSDMEAMVKVSGQSLAPTMIWGEDVLADFGVDELIPFLASKNVG